jgi:hypothetical protein
MQALTFFAAIGTILIFVLIIAIVFRKAIGRSFIVVAEVVILLVNVIFILASGAVGRMMANQYAAIYGITTDNAGLIGFIVAALAAFLVSSLISGVFFLLVQIEFNTRRVAGYFDRMTRSQNNP